MERKKHKTQREDDFDGGLCKVIEIGDDSGWGWIRVAENLRKKYSLAHIMENQEKCKKEYGNRLGKRNPDHSFEYDCRVCLGDIINGKKIDYYMP